MYNFCACNEDIQNYFDYSQSEKAICDLFPISSRTEEKGRT